MIDPITIVFPIAGTGTRSGFKFRPFLELGAGTFSETFIEAAARPFRAWSHAIRQLVFVCLEEHDAEHAVTARLAAMFGDRPHRVVRLPRPTRGPAETVMRALDAGGYVTLLFHPFLSEPQERFDVLREVLERARDAQPLREIVRARGSAPT